ncbi:MAG: FAD-linked oxidase [Spirochaetaceae bacterium]|nr:FAD-linked oxidase [Spirochaetaceae bacterium]|tara:strand:- start:33928 stop:35262 length:1335 start_codon:yes stop_codon:yes gene_type:complete
MIEHEEKLSGWGLYPAVNNTVLTGKNVETELPLYSDVTVRGLGRSYADQAINSTGYVLPYIDRQRFLAFDERTGHLECEAGLSLFEIIRVLGPRGFFPMITPGTKFVTVGGAIANDVHGKAHHVDGSFKNCVESFDILLASGKVITANRKKHSELFHANFGGLGLLGLILRARIRLRKIETTYFRQSSFRARNLDEMLDLIDEKDREFPYSVAWVNPLARGKSLGKGILTAGDHARLDELPAKLAREPLKVGGMPGLSVPFFMPGFALNALTLRILNGAIDYVQSHAGQFSHYDSFFYPLDAINNWNRGYGKRGFTQYQFVVPVEGARKSIRRIMEEIAAGGCKPFLNVLKKFGKGTNYLSFPMPGYTFAIDFPISKKLFPFLKRLDALVLDAGGRIYAGKDATLDAQSFAAMYPELDAWKKVKKKYDPKNMFQSDIGRRLGLL